MLSLSDPETLSQLGILIGLVLTAALVLLVPAWRTGLFALMFQYGLLTLLLTTLVHPAVASVRLLSGALVVLMLYITMRRVAMANRAISPEVSMAIYGEQAPPSPPVFNVGFTFRFFAGALVAVAIIGAASSMTFLSLPAFVLFGSLWLIAAGIMVAALSRDPLRLGLGILTFTSGFNLLETATDGGLFLYGLLNISDLLLALVIAHLTLLPHDVEEGVRREGAIHELPVLRVAPRHLVADHHVGGNRSEFESKDARDDLREGTQLDSDFEDADDDTRGGNLSEFESKDADEGAREVNPE